MYNLIQGDCLQEMKSIPKGSVDMILCDPPYGTTPLDWDKPIEFSAMWELYWDVLKNNGTIVLFGIEPFSTLLRYSQLDFYKYDWYWEKERLTNVFQVKRRCGKTVENVIVFYKNQPNYIPQKSKYYGKPVTNKIGEDARWSETMSGKSPKTKPFEYLDDGTRHPTQVLRFNRDNPRKLLHPTQKPVALLEYLIKTYTNEGETVLDNCMGSGSTGVACINTKRNFIGIELDQKYYSVAKSRLEEAK